ncbi:MAG: GtrA family protein [Anderseniella sp.]
MRSQTNSLIHQFSRYVAVGAIGFFVDAGLLWMLMGWGLDAYFARGISFSVAVLTTWYLNRLWTFRDTSGSTVAKQLYRYFAIQSFGLGLNLAVYALTISLLGASQLNAMAGLVFGSALGLVANFSGMRILVFKKH